SAAIDSVFRYIISMPYAVRSVLPQRTDRPCDMAHVVTTDDVVLISNAGAPFVPVCQQDPDNFQTAGGEYYLSRPHGDPPAVKCLQQERVDCLTVGMEIEPGEIRMQQHPDIGGGRELVGIACAEISRTAEPFQRISAEAFTVESADHGWQRRRERLLR